MATDELTNFANSIQAAQSLQELAAVLLSYPGIIQGTQRPLDKIDLSSILIAIGGNEYLLRCVSMEFGIIYNTLVNQIPDDLGLRSKIIQLAKHKSLQDTGLATHAAPPAPPQPAAVPQAAQPAVAATPPPPAPVQPEVKEAPKHPISQETLEKRLLAAIYLTTAINYLHQNRLVHGNLNPDSIAIDMNSFRALPASVESCRLLPPGQLFIDNEIEPANEKYHAPESLKEGGHNG